MQPRIHVITLAVEDLEGSLGFYRDGLGFPTEGIIGTEFPGDEVHAAGAAAMFHLQGGLILALYPRSELAKDAGVPVAVPSSSEFTIGHAVSSRDDVDEVLARARAAGATTIGDAHERPWGIYSGFFSDLDGHLWEVLWNPQLDADG
jgi:catechol 2,3-dioxygenase-like lactoylglutathione lyase family enzyme